MKIHTVSLVARISALVLAVAVCLAFGNKASAASTTVAGKKKVAGVAGVGALGGSGGSAGSIGLLDEAYGLLRTADHDYKGHRAHAMHEIEAAARELGSKVGGGGKGHEKQGTSDSQLEQAQKLLGEAVAGITGKAHRHIAVAISQLSVALKVK